MIAIFLHIYYPFLCDDLIWRLKRAPFAFNLYVNLVDGTSDHLASEVLAAFPGAVINVSPNQGMDPGGQLRTLNYWLKNGQDEDFIVFIQSKKDDTLRALFSSIISPEKYPLVEEAFRDGSTGMVGVKEWNLYPGLTHGDPIDFCDYYCDILKLNNFETNIFGFIGGTMFFVRAAIYKKVFAGVDIIQLVEELEPYSNGGKIHALERIFGYIVLSEGYKIKGV
jgi:lipopolysaccharide biosynthesis protein